jgi:hypothetical protein
MERAAIDRIREAVRVAQEGVHSAKLDSCDVDDIDEIIILVDRELARPNPNKNTLATYLNSLARSLGTYPAAREVSSQLDAAMREAGVPLS